MFLVPVRYFDSFIDILAKTIVHRTRTNVRQRSDDTWRRTTFVGVRRWKDAGRLESYSAQKTYLNFCAMGDSLMSV